MSPQPIRSRSISFTMAATAAKSDRKASGIRVTGGCGRDPGAVFRFITLPVGGGLLGARSTPATTHYPRAV
jgi:hypothetical protein